jgi:ribosomal subunit interface protein
MEFVIQSPGVKISEEMQFAIQDNFDKLDHLLPGIIRFNLLFNIEKSPSIPCHVQANLSVPGDDLFAKESAESFPLAARLVIDDLENQIRKNKEKRSNHHTQPLA